MNSIIFQLRVLLLFFYKEDFGIKLPAKIDMPLNKETKTKQISALFIYILIH